ncbi:MAG: glycosyltransferase family 4 protein [Candidatus Omnitrophica bacterium]|nr:glycosyltransferase family 4 protein [Candidatus Omnitrophota bacterium]
MKILSISNLNIWPFGKGKGIPSVIESQRGLANLGHEVYFLCPRKSKEDPLSEECDGIHVIRFPMPFNINSHDVYNQPLDSLFNKIKVSAIFNLEWFFYQTLMPIVALRTAARIKPDIIYAHSASSAFAAFCVSRLRKIKYILRVYGIRYWEWISLKGRIKSFRDYLAFKLPAASYIVTNDGTNADAILKNIGIPENKIHCWRNGVDELIRTPVDNAKQKIADWLKIDPNAKIIISTSRLIPTYGIDKLVELLPQILNNNPETICLIAGAGPDKEKIEKIINKNNIGDKVRLLGVVERQRIVELLNAADIYIFLARHHNCTNTMWEAMCTGKCIVTMRNKNIEQALTDKENAILLDNNDPQQMLSILDDLLANDAKRTGLGHKARERANEILQSWPERVKIENDLLEGIVNA